MVIDPSSLAWGLSIAGFIFGIIHLAAWDISFPTTPEKYLWRISSLVLMCSMTFLLLKRVFNKLVVRKFFYFVFGKETTESLFSWSLLLTIGLYASSRVFLFLYPFRALQSIPVGAYVVPTWFSYIPHL